MRLVKWPKIDVKKCQNLILNINLGATFLFLSILCSIKIERLLFLKFLKKLAFFDSYFWPFNKTHEKIIANFVISAIIASTWNIFIKFHWWKTYESSLSWHFLALTGIQSKLNRSNGFEKKNFLWEYVVMAHRTRLFWP